MKMQRYSIAGNGMGDASVDKDDLCGDWVHADEALPRIEELERNLADLQESVKAQHLREFGVTGDSTLPPWPDAKLEKLSAGRFWVESESRTGSLFTRSSPENASAAAWREREEHSGLTRERYQRLLACERFVGDTASAPCSRVPGDCNRHGCWPCKAGLILAQAPRRLITHEEAKRRAVKLGAKLGWTETPSETKLPAGWEDWSIKRAAWAYGCAKKESDDEGVLLTVLLAIARDEVPPSEDWKTCAQCKAGCVIHYERDGKVFCSLPCREAYDTATEPEGAGG